MEIFGLNIGALFQNPVEMIIFAVLGVSFVPAGTFALDYVTQLISDGMVKVNEKVVERIPIVGIKKWIQARQIEMLEKSIKSYQATIKKLKK